MMTLGGRTLRSLGSAEMLRIDRNHLPAARPERLELPTF